MAPALDVADLVSRAREGQPRAVARLISMVEDAAPAMREVTAALAPYSGRAHVVGLTGAPGVGKSTSTSALVAAYRAQGLRVGVLAVDPSSPFSGGALLGDRVRMQEHATDPGVYIRSMASRGHLGGLAWATPQAVRVLDAAGYDVVLVETVGVGQSEVEIAGAADTTVVPLGMGDGVQAAKAASSRSATSSSSTRPTATAPTPPRASCAHDHPGPVRVRAAPTTRGSRRSSHRRRDRCRGRRGGGRDQGRTASGSSAPGSS
ncbi:MAG: hypothetical protein U0R76_07125 [Candidatus Nanopelagicales bacterium]